MPAAAGHKFTAMVDFGRPAPVNNLFGILNPQSADNYNLSSYYSAQHLAMLAALRPGLIRGSYHADYDTARSMGAQFQLLTEQFWDSQWYSASNPSGEPYNNFTLYSSRMTADANYWKARIDAGEEDLLDWIRFEVWNEPDGATFWRGTVANYTTMAVKCAQAYQGVLGPRARMCGPSLSYIDADSRTTWINPLIAAYYAAGLELYALDMHHLQRPWDAQGTTDGAYPDGARGLIAALQRLKNNHIDGFGDYQKVGCNTRELTISEVGGQSGLYPSGTVSGTVSDFDANAMPAFMLAHLDSAERGGAHLMCLADFSPYSDSPTLNGLTDTDASPRSGWWMWKAIQDGRPGRVYARKQQASDYTVAVNDEPFVVLASTTGAGGDLYVDGTDPFVMITVVQRDRGSLNTDVSTGTAHVQLRNIRAIPRFAFATQVRVLFKQINSGNSAVPTPPVLSSADYTIDASGSVTFDVGCASQRIEYLHLTDVP